MTNKREEDNEENLKFVEFVSPANNKYGVGGMELIDRGPTHSTNTAPMFFCSQTVEAHNKKLSMSLCSAH